MDKYTVETNIVYYILITFIGAGFGGVLSDICNLDVSKSIVGGIIIIWSLSIFKPN